MQKRRRDEASQPKDPAGSKIRVPSEYWNDLKDGDVDRICENALARFDPPGGIILPCLGQMLLVDRSEKCIKQLVGSVWLIIEDSLLELLCLLYLLNVGPQALHHELVSTLDLKDAHFFRGPHSVDVSPLLKRFGHDIAGFKKTSKSLDGELQDMADIAYKLPVFPKVPVYLLFWEGDDEFEPRISVLFDRSVEKFLSADAIWGTYNLVVRAMLGKPFKKITYDNGLASRNLH